MDADFVHGDVSDEHAVLLDGHRLTAKGLDGPAEGRLEGLSDDCTG